MNKFKILTGLLLVFILGILTGVLITRMIIEQRIERFARGGPPAARVLEKYSSRLGLNESQKRAFEEIILQTRAKLQEHRRKFHPGFEKIMDESHMKMKEYLNPQQKEELDKMYDEMKRRGHKKSFRKIRTYQQKDKIPEGSNPSVNAKD